jgi:hypothetical protein
VIWILGIIAGAVVFHNLHQQGLITAFRGPNNNLGCIPLIAVFILTIWLITQIPVSGTNP